MMHDFHGLKLTTFRSFTDFAQFWDKVAEIIQFLNGYVALNLL